MTRTMPAGASATAPAPRPPRPELPARRSTLGAIATLFVMELDRQCRARRLLFAVPLFLLPIVIALVARYYRGEALDRDRVEFALVFLLLPHALVPLTALLYTSSMIQDEIEEQTLTYLLIRPLPKWAIYAVKLLATILVTSALVGVFTVATYVAINWGAPDLWRRTVLDRAPKTDLLMALALLAYGSLFGCASLLVRRALALGVAYIILFEGIVANFDFLGRRLTVMYYFRVLCERWLQLDRREWRLKLDEAPDAPTCVLVLLATSLVATILAAAIFTLREIRVKTPEGS